MTFRTLAQALLACACITPAFANEGPTPQGVGPLDHVWVIMMENHAYAQVFQNPNAPFINQEINAANAATNYYAVAHPSLTNYLEITGGSNFGVLDDNSPDWGDTACLPNLATATTSWESVTTPICPIAGNGTDAATPLIDEVNETQGPPGDIEIDGTHSYPADAHISGKTIADQLVANHLSWKSYQESLPLGNAYGVDSSDGIYTSNTVFTAAEQALGLTDSNEVGLYAVKHNPFAYFASVQQGKDKNLSMTQTVSMNQLYADLATGTAPNFSLVVPNQCDDMHGRSNAGPFCAYDPNDNGTQTGLNPGLIMNGDASVQRLVTAIKGAPMWKSGRNAIVIVWDENDYSLSPTTNQVVLIVDKNYGSHGKTSNVYYTSFSLLASLESAFGLPCLNHACDASTTVMGDLFQ